MKISLSIWKGKRYNEQMFKPARLIWEKKPIVPECVGDAEMCSPTKKELDKQKRELVPQAVRIELEKFKSSNSKNCLFSCFCSS